MFGSNFGRGTSAFGQSSTFGKPTTGFSGTTFGTSGSSMFGQTTQPSTNLFGNTAPSAFGQTNTTSSFGTFGGNTGTSLFGGQQNTPGMTGSIFGATNTNANTTNTGLFGSTGTSAFGQPSSSGFGFGSPAGGSSIFGQNQAVPQPSSIFGQPSSSTTGLFGTTAGAFGSTTGTTGTPIKFIPLNGTDTVAKNGTTSTISTKHNCISCMKEYEAKSLEELRYEDYSANRKGSQGGTQTGVGMFGGTGTSGGALFGSSTPTSTSGSIFGGSSFGQPSVFGQPNTSAGGLFGKTTTAVTPFGATTTTPSTGGFGSFNQTPSLFGSNAAQTKSAFGNTQTGGMFGSTATGTTGFGSAPQQQQPAFGFGTQQTTQAGGSLFQQPQNKFGFGTPSTSSFTFGTNTTSSNTMLFGKPTGTAFGMPSSTTAPTFGAGTFGATSSQPSLFGGGFNKPQTSTFSFGQSNTTGIGTGTSIFGNATAAKPAGGSLFGNTTAGNFGAGGFGTGTSTFGSGSNTTFGNSSGFGNSFASNSGLSSAPPAGNVGYMERLQMLTALPYGDSPVFKRIFPTDKKSDVKTASKSPDNINDDVGIAKSNVNYRVSPKVNNLIKRIPVEYKHHHKKCLFDGLDDPNERNLFVQRSSPRHLILKPKPVENSNLEDVKIVDNYPTTSIFQTDPTLRSEDDSPHRSTAENENPVTRKVALSPINGFGDSNMDGSVKLNEEKLSNMSPNNESTPIRNLKSRILHESKTDIVETPVKSLSTENEQQSRVGNNQNVRDNVNRISESSSLSDASEECRVYSENAIGAVLTKQDYYTIPELDKLSLDKNGKCVVNSFSIGRQDFGNISFLTPVDVAGMNFDETVNISYKEVEVYPDELTKPPVGMGLNTQALVTLDRIWPIDKTTREFIKDARRIQEFKFEDKLKKSCAKMNSSFVQYRPETGSFVFEVEHFSKYRLIDDSDDSDDDEEENVKGASKENLTPTEGNVGMAKPSSKEQMIKRTEDVHQFLVKSTVLQRSFSGNVNSLMVDAPLDDFKYEPMSGDTDYENYGISPKLSEDLDSSYIKMRLLKASFYMDEIDDETDMDVDKSFFYQSKNADITDKTNLHTSLFKPQFTTAARLSHLDQTAASTDAQVLESKLSTQKSTTALPQPDVTSTFNRYPMIKKTVNVAPVKFKNACVPFKESILSMKNLVTDRDAGLMLSASFRVGWSHNLTLINLTSERLINDNLNTEDVFRLLGGREANDYSKNVACVSKLQISNQDYLQENVANHLEICLRQSTITFENGVVPLFVAKSGTKVLQEHCILSRQIGSLKDSYDRQVWELMDVLWGNIAGFKTGDNPFNHHNNMLRKNALSDWLENVIQSAANFETNENNYVSSIISLLSAHKISDACDLAMSHKDYNLALLMSQIGSNQMIRALVADQLNEWRKSEADTLIGHNRLKVMTLVAGETFFLFNKRIMNTCENLDWKSAFALHLWYITSPCDSLMEALSMYEDAFSDDINKVNAPDPPYADTVVVETSKSGKIQDLCFHLLKLYSSRSHPLIKLINPLTHTSNVLDYRLSWFVMMTLKSLGYQHLLEEEEVHYHVSFATQLQTYGMWEWAVFVLLHIKNVDRRSKVVLHVIERNVELLPDHTACLTEKEHFLTDNLKIPAEWIFSSKAVLACFHKRFEEAAWYYIKAEKWNEAHDIVMQHLLPGAVLRENYDTIEKLLGELILSEKAISNWNHRGNVIWNYLNVSKRIEQLMEAEDDNIKYYLEQLQPVMVAVCENALFLPTTTAKERLCQAEISSRMVQYVQTVINFQKPNMAFNRFIGDLANKLPLPDDYVQSELLQCISHCAE